MTKTTRIDLIRAIEEYGNLFPDMRLGQIVANLVTLARDPTNATEVAEATWEVGDEELLLTLRSSIDQRMTALDGESDRSGTSPDDTKTAINFFQTWLELLRVTGEFADRYPSRRSARLIPKDHQE